MKIDDALMQKIAPDVSPALRTEYAGYLNVYCYQYEINDQLRLAAFLANIMVESGRLTRTQENLNYSAQRLMQVWPRRFPTFDIASQYAHSPQKLANYVYNGRNGNHPNTDDGWNYRGGGFLQETGRGNYRELGNEIDIDLETHPEYLRTPKGAIETACAGWSVRGCNRLAEQKAITAIREKINGGTNGLADVKHYYGLLLSWIPNDFTLDRSSVGEVAFTPLGTSTLPIDSDHIPSDTFAPDKGLPADSGDSTASSLSDTQSLPSQPVNDSNAGNGQGTQGNGISANGTQVNSTSDPQVIKKESPSTFIKWITALKVMFGAVLTGLTTWCSSNDIANSVASKAADRAVTNVDQSFLVHLGVILLYTLIGVGAGVLLMYLGSKFYDRAAERANKLNLAKADIASNDSKATVEFTNDRARTTGIEQGKT